LWCEGSTFARVVFQAHHCDYTNRNAALAFWVLALTGRAGLGRMVAGGDDSYLLLAGR
jgi:hypothetical protein